MKREFFFIEKAVLSKLRPLALYGDNRFDKLIKRFCAVSKRKVEKFVRFFINYVFYFNPLLINYVPTILENRYNRTSSVKARRGSKFDEVG